MAPANSHRFTVPIQSFISGHSSNPPKWELLSKS